MRLRWLAASLGTGAALAAGLLLTAASSTPASAACDNNPTPVVGACENRTTFGNPTGPTPVSGGINAEAIAVAGTPVVVAPPAPCPTGIFIQSTGGGAVGCASGSLNTTSGKTGLGTTGAYPADGVLTVYNDGPFPGRLTDFVFKNSGATRPAGLVIANLDTPANFVGSLISHYGGTGGDHQQGYTGFSWTDATMQKAQFELAMQTGTVVDHTYDVFYAIPAGTATDGFANFLFGPGPNSPTPKTPGATVHIYSNDAGDDSGGLRIENTVSGGRWGLRNDASGNFVLSDISTGIGFQLNQTTHATSITSPNSGALSVGRLGATNPAFKVDASTANQQNGLIVTGSASSGAVALSTGGGGSNIPLTVDSNGTGSIVLANTSTGVIGLRGPAATRSMVSIGGNGDTTFSPPSPGGAFTLAVFDIGAAGLTSPSGNTGTLAGLHSRGGTFTVNTADTHAVAAALALDAPTMTVSGGGAITNGATLYIAGDSTGASSNTGLYNGGTTKLVGNVGIGAAASTTTGLLTAASTTAQSSLRIPSGTAPTSPVDGDMWYDGTNVKFRVGGTTKTFTLA